MAETLEERFKKVFDLEMQGWCYGIENYPGEVFPGLVHAIIKELKPAIRSAIEYGYSFDILRLSKKIAKASKFLISTKEVTFSILAQLPSPVGLSKNEQFILGQIVDQAEKSYGGALDRLKKKWRHEIRQQKESKQER